MQCPYWFTGTTIQCVRVQEQHTFEKKFFLAAGGAASFPAATTITASKTRKRNILQIMLSEETAQTAKLLLCTRTSTSITTKQTRRVQSRGTCKGNPPRAAAARLLTFCTITDLFGFSLRIFHLMTSKMNHDDRNGHFAHNFLHCEAMISSFAKVTGLQSRLLLEKTGVQNRLDTKNIVLR